MGGRSAATRQAADSVVLPATRVPVWNLELRRLVRFWSAGTGLDEAVIDSLRSGDLDQLTITEPSADLAGLSC